MKINLNEEFLLKYKMLETEIRVDNVDKTVMDYENELMANDADKLRICRQIRNYIQHHEDGNQFLNATAEMIDFIVGRIEEIRSKKATVKDYLYRLTPLSNTDTWGEVVNRFTRTKRAWLPVVDKEMKYIGAINQIDVIEATNNGELKKKIEKTKTKLDNNIRQVSVSEFIEEYIKEKQDLIVTNKETQKYIGVVKWK